MENVKVVQTLGTGLARSNIESAPIVLYCDDSPLIHPQGRRWT